MTFTESRWSLRKSEPVPFHLRLIDDDQDRHEDALEDVAAQLRGIQRTLYALVVAIMITALTIAGTTVFS